MSTACRRSGGIRSVSATTRIASIASAYVRSFTDTWSALVNATFPFFDYHGNALCNPLMDMEDELTVDCHAEGETTLVFRMKVDDNSGEGNASIVFMAIDSFLSLLSASSASQLVSLSDSEDNGKFLLFVIADAPSSTLLNSRPGQRGFPAGDTYSAPKNPDEESLKWRPKNRVLSSL